MYFSPEEAQTHGLSKACCTDQGSGSLHPHPLNCLLQEGRQACKCGQKAAGPP